MSISFNYGEIEVKFWDIAGSEELSVSSARWSGDELRVACYVRSVNISMIWKFTQRSSSSLYGEGAAEIGHGESWSHEGTWSRM